MEWVLVWFFFGVVCMLIANNKGRSGCGWFILGCLLGPFALVVGLLSSVKEEKMQEAQKYGAAGDYKKCPYCAEVVLREAIKCKHCGSDLTTQPVASAAPGPEVNVAGQPLASRPPAKNLSAYAAPQKDDSGTNRAIIAFVILVAVLSWVFFR